MGPRNQASGETSQLDASIIAARVQSTLISNAVTRAQWERHIAECLEFHFHAAMIPPCWVKDTVRALQGSGIRTASFIDFPNGTMTSRSKAREAVSLVDDGVQEIDLMPNVGFLLSGMESEYFRDIQGVVEEAGNVPVKIMLELPLLNPQQQERAVTLSIEAGVSYLKNASGGAVGTAKPEEIRFLRRLAPPNVRIKASGGIKTASQVRALIEAGADLIGTSAGARIIRELGEGETASETDSSSY
ncbi:MAG TPA: deoxyribose-phosphate aldolase [Candidatus Acidoferrum sp.]|nr:deoxyribose-phosphate aldolase [Candidatus Acidoferrum sp.]